VIAALVAPLLASVLLGLLGPLAGRRSGGGVAVRLIPLTAVLVAGSTLIAIAGLAVVVLARVDGIATVARIAVGALPAAFREVPIAVGVGAAAVATVLVAAVVHRGGALGRVLIDTHRACASLEPGSDGAYLVDDPSPRAFAAAGLRGRVVVSTGLWSALAPADRVAVLAHERAHLARRHHLSLIAVRLAAAADPLLLPLVAATRFAVEREADEDAATAVGRRAVGIAVARAGLVLAADQRRTRAREPELAMASGDVPARVQALLAAPVRALRWPVVPVVALAMLAGALLVDNAMATDHHIDHARAVRAAGDHRSAITEAVLQSQ
jgi:Zn-dependent protease with chaperone function